MKTGFFQQVWNWIKCHKTVTWIATMLISAIVGAFVSWYVGWLMPSKEVAISNLPKKDLSCILNYSKELITRNTADNKLQITYDGIPVEAPHVYDISIQNSGNLAIDNTDFKQDFVIEFSGCGGILSCRLSKSTNSSIAEEVVSNARFENEKLIISDFFLNPGESFSLLVITNGAASRVDYQARLSGISKLSIHNAQAERIAELVNNRHSSMTLFIIILGAVMIGIIAYLVVIWHLNKRDKRIIQKQMEEYRLSLDKEKQEQTNE